MRRFLAVFILLTSIASPCITLADMISVTQTFELEAITYADSNGNFSPYSYVAHDVEQLTFNYFDLNLGTLNTAEISIDAAVDYWADLGVGMDAVHTYSYTADVSAGMHVMPRLPGDPYTGVSDSRALSVSNPDGLTRVSDVLPFNYTLVTPGDYAVSRFLGNGGFQVELGLLADMAFGQPSGWLEESWDFFDNPLYDHDGAAAMINASFDGAVTVSYDYTPVSQDSPAPVPEPATMLLLGTGLAGVAGFRKKFNKL